MTTTWNECQFACCECYIDFSFSYYQAPLGPAWCADVSEEQQEEKKTKDKLNEHKTTKKKKQTKTYKQINKQTGKNS